MRISRSLVYSRAVRLRSAGGFASTSLSIRKGGAADLDATAERTARPGRST
jgi:hypothetical protein